MNTFHPKRIWLWIAVAAIAIAMIALLVPHHGNTVDQHACVALLPVFFIGLIAAINVEPLPAVLTVDHAPEPPALAPSFQRPPPFWLV
jgi:hypothetical protein